MIPLPLELKADIALWLAFLAIGIHIGRALSWKSRGD